MTKKKAPKRKLSEIGNGESPLMSPAKKAKSEAKEENNREELIKELKDLLLPCTQEMIETEAIESLMCFDKNDSGETCLWVAMIESPLIALKQLLVSFPGYPSETETHTFWIRVQMDGCHELCVYQTSDIVLEDKFASLFDPNNRKACEVLLKHSTELLTKGLAPDAYHEDSDGDSPFYATSWLRTYASQKAKEKGINLRLSRQTKKKLNTTKKRFNQIVKAVARIRKTQRKRVIREDKIEERKRQRQAKKEAEKEAKKGEKDSKKKLPKKKAFKVNPTKKTAPMKTSSQKAVGAETSFMPAKPENHNWELTEFNGQDTMELCGVIPVSHKALKAPPDENNCNPDEIEIVFSFDTTASMYRVLETVRANVNKTINRLFHDIPNLRIGVMTHGDYISRDTSYTCRWVDLTKNEEQLSWFVANVGKTYGGDAAECYELVLHNICREFSWSDTCQARSLVLIGDETPHELNKNNPYHLDWREKLKDCKACGIKIYSVQCRDQNSAKDFYKTCANETDGVYLTLENMDSFPGMMVAICHREKDLTKEKPRSEEFKKEKEMFKQKCEALETLSISDLKDLLRGNDQKISGTKIELIKRIVDCQMYGCMPRCPQCNTGRLRVIYATKKSYGHGGQGRFYCPGYYEDASYHGCTWTGDQTQITRSPWEDKKISGDD